MSAVRARLSVGMQNFKSRSLSGPILFICIWCLCVPVCSSVQAPNRRLQIRVLSLNDRRVRGWSRRGFSGFSLMRKLRNDFPFSCERTSRCRALRCRALRCTEFIEMLANCFELRSTFRMLLSPFVVIKRPTIACPILMVKDWIFLKFQFETFNQLQVVF